MAKAKRLFSFLLVLAIMAGMFPAEVLASEVQSGYVTETYVNPLYANVVTEADLKQPSGVILRSDPTYYTSESEAAVEIRENLVNRVESFTIGFKTTSSDYTAVGKSLVEEAQAHTGKPTEGDYLRWQYAGYSFRVSYGSSGGSYTMIFTYTFTYYTDASQEAAVTQAVNALLAQLKPSGSDYQKIKTVYDWICENVVYDYDHLNDSSYKLQFTAYAALLNKTSVCQGYALLLYRLALEMGIDCRLITGIGNGGGHAWNIVKLNNLYYNADATWDSDWAQAGLDYAYFLKSDANFGDHTRDSDYSSKTFYAAYPMSTADYDPDQDACGNGHHYAAVVTTPTCTDQGYTTYTCSKCQDSYRGEYTDALGHSWDEGTVTKKATETETGTMLYTCTICGETKTQIIPELSRTHSYTSTVVAPTCTERGYTNHVCACGNSYQDTYTDALGHQCSSTVTTESTCTTAGVRTWNCANCDYSYTEVIEATGHSYKDKVTAPTCTEQGCTTYTCACGDFYVKDYTAALGHNYVKGVCTRCRDEIPYLDAPVISASNVASTGKNQITWSAVSGATAYMLYIYDANGSQIKTTVTTDTSLIHSDAVVGTTYSYRVQAMCEEDRVTSELSESVSLICILAQPVVTVSNVASSGKVKISWNSVDDATQYRLYIYDANGNQIRTASTTNTSITHNSAVAGTTYTYKVRALCSVSAATSAYSSGKVRTCDLAQPTVSITRSGSKPKLTWKAVSGAVKYQIYRATSKNGTYSLLKTTTSRSYTDTSAKSGRTYYYKVVAVHTVSAAKSAYSTVVSIKSN